jgi:hypothetical protein
MGLFDPKLEFIVDASAIEPPAVTVETIQAALDKVRRVVICSPDVAMQLTEEVKREGLSGTVKIVASEHLGTRTAYITRPGALADLLRDTGAGYAQRWVADYDRGHPAPRWSVEDGGLPE